MRLLQRRHDAVALLLIQRALLKPLVQQAQVIHFLQDAKALRAGQRQRRTLQLGQQRAATRFDGAQAALMQQCVAQIVACSVGELRRVQAGLSGPQRIKLIGNHLPVNVQVVAFLDACLAVFPGHTRFAVACPRAGARLHAPP